MTPIHGSIAKVAAILSNQGHQALGFSKLHNYVRTKRFLSDGNQFVKANLFRRVKELNNFLNFVMLNYKKVKRVNSSCPNSVILVGYIHIKVNVPIRITNH